MISIFYIFLDPLGNKSSKIGMTSHLKVRLGQYQNSYSCDSHLAQFDVAYIGKLDVITSLENAVKRRYADDIKHEGRGFTEWISGYSSMEIEQEVDKIIAGYRFKVEKVPAKYLPITIDNAEKLLENLTNNKTTA